MMKNNTSLTKAHLKQALAEMPNDFSLSETRNYIVAALNHLEKVENKRQQRDSQNKQAEIQRKLNTDQWTQLNPAQQLSAMEVLDNMVKEAKKDLEDIQNNNKKKGQDGIQTIFD